MFDSNKARFGSWLCYCLHILHQHVSSLQMCYYRAFPETSQRLKSVHACVCDCTGINWGGCWQINTVPFHAESQKPHGTRGDFRWQKLHVAAASPGSGWLPFHSGMLAVNHGGLRPQLCCDSVSTCHTCSQRMERGSQDWIMAPIAPAHSW